MKLSLRRAPAPTDDSAAPPTPPRGRPVAEYAAILDGEHLWVAVAATAGTFALRDSASGELVPVPADLEDEGPERRSARLDLTALPGTGEATYDVVVVPPGGRSPAAVWTHPLPPPGATVAPPAGDGTTRFAVRRAEDGTLRVARRVDPPAPELVDVAATPGSVTLHLSGAQGDLQLRHEGAVVATYPIIDGRVTLAVDELPLGVGRQQRLVVGTGDDVRPVRRRRNGLAAPGEAALLPLLFGEDADRPRVRFAWSRDATLLARLFDPEPETGPGSGSSTEPTTEPTTSEDVA